MASVPAPVTHEQTDTGPGTTTKSPGSPSALPSTSWLTVPTASYTSARITRLLSKG